MELLSDPVPFWFCLLVAVGVSGAWIVRLRMLRRRDRISTARLQATIEKAAALAAAQERERIYNDLHDDLGAKLLQLVYAAPTPAIAEQARAALQDLRDVVSRSRGASGDLEQVLGEIRSEATQRLATAGTRLSWEQPEPLPPVALDPARALHLYRIVREAISNALRHAQAQRLRVRIRLTRDLLAFELTDDGDEPASVEAAGQGMRGMRQRAEQLQGDIRWTRGTEGGTKVLLTLPLVD